MDKKLLFIDIETVAETNNYDTYLKKKIRAERYCNDIGDLTEEQAYYKKAWLHAEFGKIICISFGTKTMENEIKTSSFVGDEKVILEKFFELLSRMPEYEIAGHNIKSFDLPFIFRRSIINGIKPHAKVSFYGLKPWEVQATDTIEIWKNWWYISSWLEIIAVSLGIPSPKGKMSGDKVFDYFYGANMTDKDNWKPIAEYCEWDVRTTMMIYDKIMDPIKTFNIQQPEIIPDELPPIPSGKDIPWFNDKEFKELEEKKEYIKSFPIEDTLVEEIEKNYKISKDMRAKIWKLRWDTRWEESGSEEEGPF